MSVLLLSSLLLLLCLLFCMLFGLTSFPHHAVDLLIIGSRAVLEHVYISVCGREADR